VTVAATLTRGRWLRAIALGVVVAVLSVVLATVANPRALASPDGPQITARERWDALRGHGSERARLVVWHLRLPRVGLAALVGAALALAGALLQALLRNPLADPFVIGVSSGAALAAVAGVALGVSAGGGGHPAVAAAGALGAALVVERLARTRSGRLSGERMVLAGVVASYLFSAGIMWVVSLSGAAETQRYLFWLMGSTASASGREVLLLGAVLAACLLASVALLPALNLVMLSEEHARDSGVPVERVKRATFVVAAVLTGGAVAVAGSIGFVGLVVPHAVRLAWGADARLAAPLSACAGATFLVAADLASQAAGDVPLGVVTASVGAPFFLWLLVKRSAP